VTQQSSIQIRRIYDDPEPSDGQRVLVDRLWPRGISKERADLTEWCREVSPSNDLRTWYEHDPAKHDEFVRRYRAELDHPERAEAFAHLRKLASTGPLTLLTSTKAVDISHARVLHDLLSADSLSPDS
jgi:uncharacterized protein YeaO (DUF488 family)